MDQERKLREQQEKTVQLQQQLENMQQSRSGKKGTDPKAAKRLPTCPPPKFNGINQDYIPWKRLWAETMGKGYMEAVQLMQLKITIPARTANMIVRDQNYEGLLVINGQGISGLQCLE